MINVVLKGSRSDAGLLRLLEIAREYADIYLLAKRRQKGCDGMGELAMVKAEFREAVDDLIDYCRGKGYLADDIRYDLDIVADELSEVRINEG